MSRNQEFTVGCQRRSSARIELAHLFSRGYVPETDSPSFIIGKQGLVIEKNNTKIIKGMGFGNHQTRGPRGRVPNMDRFSSTSRQEFAIGRKSHSLEEVGTIFARRLEIEGLIAGGHVPDPNIAGGRGETEAIRGEG